MEQITVPGQLLYRRAHTSGRVAGMGATCWDLELVGQLQVSQPARVPAGVEAGAGVQSEPVLLSDRLGSGAALPPINIPNSNVG